MKISISWGTAVALVYAAFATATLAFVAFALGRPVDLVSADYYAQSLRQDRQMDAERNTRALGDAASVVQTGDRALVVSLPAAARDARGTVTLYRPSDASADRVIALATDTTGRQQIALDGLRPG